MAKTALGTKVANNPGHTYITIPEFPKAQLNQKAYYYLPSPTAPPLDWIPVKCKFLSSTVSDCPVRMNLFFSLESNCKPIVRVSNCLAP